jgi:hypothetical protein
VELTNVSVTVKPGDRVEVRYLPATTERMDGFLVEHYEWLSVNVGDLMIGGRPAHVVEFLSRALTEAYVAWETGSPDGPDDGNGGAAAAVVALPAPSPNGKEVEA